ncbi:MAG TPA: hypothetical protein DEB39_10895 [Planctomycetaceae bacterium]|nr:hypothetical protein [Planctomycetaceae bacterium]
MNLSGDNNFEADVYLKRDENGHSVKSACRTHSLTTFVIAGIYANRSSDKRLFTGGSYRSRLNFLVKPPVYLREMPMASSGPF